MRFSIRSLFAVTFLVALGMLTWTTYRRAEVADAESAVLHEEISALETSLQLRNRTWHDARLNAMDADRELIAMGEVAEEHFERLYQKYSSIEPKPGILSLRTLPALPNEGGERPMLFRIWVPEDRDVWLKFAVDPHESAPSRSVAADELQHLKESRFDVSGPFELRLEPGDHILRIEVIKHDESYRSLEVVLDDELLLSSDFRAPSISGGGTSSISAPEQTDFDPDRDAPWLLTGHFNYKGTDDSLQINPEFSVWLSDKSTEYSEFPRE